MEGLIRWEKPLAAEVYSPVDGDEFVVGRSFGSIGIQNCRKGNERSGKDSKRFSRREEGKSEKDFGRESLGSLRKFKEKI